MRSRAALVVTGLSVGLGLLATVAYLWRPDPLAALTMLPAWFWAVPGSILSVLAYRRGKGRAVLVLLGLWVVYLMVCAEQTRSLGRWLWSWRSQPEAIRVVSLNCSGDKRAAAEVVALHPDIVLLQEAPSKPSVKALAEQLWGRNAGVAWENDTAILTRGEIADSTNHVSTSAHWVQARVRLPGVADWHVVSLRLAPGVVRFDLWNPSCWTAQAADRRQRRTWLAEVARHVASVPVRMPVIVGGDFNAVGGDPVYRALRPRLADAFAVAGTGWGDTLVNDVPLVRVDQVWTSREVRPVRVFVRKSRYTDHRMVVCDLETSMGR